MSIQHHIAKLYFDYEPNTGHQPDCSRGPDTWQVARYVEYGFGDQADEIRRTSLRLSCPECGVIEFHTVDGYVQRQWSSSAELGYGAAPVRLAGLWLWPGPIGPYDRERGPESYFVTTDNVRPSSPEMVAGSLGWSRNYARTNGAVRWHAGLGCHKWGGIVTAAPGPFTSRTAAAKWLAAELAAASSSAAAE